MTFGEAFDAVHSGLTAWRSKHHNAKWWKHIDGTPIPNDLSVCIAESVQDSVSKWTPTPEAYDAACKALAHWRAEAKRLGKIAKVKPREMAQQ